MTMILSKLLPLTLQQQCNKTTMPPALQVVVGARDDVFNGTDLQMEALIENNYRPGRKRQGTQTKWECEQCNVASCTTLECWYFYHRQNLLVGEVAGF
jgi:hypothetical protein